MTAKNQSSRSRNSISGKDGIQSKKYGLKEMNTFKNRKSNATSKNDESESQQPIGVGGLRKFAKRYARGQSLQSYGGKAYNELI